MTHWLPPVVIINDLLVTFAFVGLPLQIHQVGSGIVDM